jgi:cell division protein FtsI (penicillin-binding protein 3)
MAEIGNADGSVVFTSLNVDDNQVPDLTGMGARDAIYALENVGLKAKVMGRGKVKRQSVAPGGKFVPGQTVVLELN